MDLKSFRKTHPLFWHCSYFFWWPPCVEIFYIHTHYAIQELSRKNNKLQEDNDTKTNKITSLESRIEALEEAILAMQSLIQGLQ